MKIHVKHVYTFDTITTTDLNKWIGLTRLALHKPLPNAMLELCCRNYWLMKFQSRYSLPMQSLSNQQDRLLFIKWYVCQCAM